MLCASGRNLPRVCSRGVDFKTSSFDLAGTTLFRCSTSARDLLQERDLLSVTMSPMRRRFSLALTFRSAKISVCCDAFCLQISRVVKCPDFSSRFCATSFGRRDLMQKSVSSAIDVNSGDRCVDVERRSCRSCIFRNKFVGSAALFELLGKRFIVVLSLVPAVAFALGGRIRFLLLTVGEMPPRRRGRASRQAVVDSRTPVSADREDASQPSVPLEYSESQSSAFRSLASAVNRAVDLMESLVVGQTRVQQSTGQSVDPVPSGTSSSQPSVAPQSLSRQRFRSRGRRFKRSSSSSSSSGGSGGARANASFCGQCGGKHRPSRCVGVRGSCNNCGHVGHFARVCPTLGQQALTRSSSRRPYRPFQSQLSGFQPPEASNARELSLSEQSGLQLTQVDATTVERDDALTGEGCSGSCSLLVNSV
ncbi:hypothetical protein F511_33701 [Dorcoceras hygrometricum]|uniref:CCHC-type domain-containing protein n=1 Tax=Dorcoceras hygrometricum TaxID=472368 RepID=A0A2Z7CEV3_9LAMI|nr:hypothetical protein F511_33701 [Dorcoceras hygrometricum]